MAKKRLVTSDDMHKLRVLGGKRGTRRIGRVKSCVFHPSERRCIGLIVKRPDFLWMFHRKDMFVALDGFSFADGRIVIKDDAEATGFSACRRLGVSWDDCVLWEGMPLMTADGTAVGYVGKVTFSLADGAVESVEASNGAAAKYLLGALTVPAELVRGFKRGMGAHLAVRDDSRDTETSEEFLGAILVSDEVWELTPEGGWAESAGEFTAKAVARAKEKAAQYAPKVQEATHAAGEAINEGAYAVGKQVAASKGMFSAFKEEFDKARNGEEGVELAKAADEEESDMSGMFASFKEEFDKARGADASQVEADDYDDDEYEEEPAPAKKAPAKKTAKPAAKQSSIGGMFAAFKEEYDKARNE